MNHWSNIEVTPDDPEIIQINHLEKKLGNLPEKVRQIRELITRFEVCHFRYQHHLEKIENSVLCLEPDVDPQGIGKNHIQKGEEAWKNDRTGRSKTGQQYLWAIRQWLDEDLLLEIQEHYNQKLGKKIMKWLGSKNPAKTRLVRLLLARLIWDWKMYEELQEGGDLKELELQICRTDICHYAFPDNLDSVLQAIGSMKPVKNFGGCGTFSPAIQAVIEEKISSLHALIQSMIDRGKSDKNELIRAWLLTCLVKTIKEQVGSKKPLIE